MIMHPSLPCRTSGAFVVDHSQLCATQQMLMVLHPPTLATPNNSCTSPQNAVALSIQPSLIMPGSH
jgi:hypothetical protein